MKRDLIPLSGVIIKNFGLQSISTWRPTASNKWRISIRSQSRDRIMRKRRWWFSFKGFSIISEYAFRNKEEAYLNLRLTFSTKCNISKAKHDSKRKTVTGTIYKLKRQVANSCQFTVFNFAHLKTFLESMTQSVRQKTHF